MLKQHVYSVLVISCDENLNGSLKLILPSGIFSPIDFVLSVSQAKRSLLQRSYDIVIVNTPLKDEHGAELASELSLHSSSAVLLCAKESHMSGLKEQLIDLGILVLSKPFSQKVLLQAMDDLCSHRQKLKGYEKKVTSIEEKMQEIRLVNRAKSILIKEKGLSEDAAHHYIEKQAMDSHQSKSTIAAQIISSSN